MVVSGGGEKPEAVERRGAEVLEDGEEFRETTGKGETLGEGVEERRMGRRGAGRVGDERAEEGEGGVSGGGRSEGLRGDEGVDEGVLGRGNGVDGSWERRRRRRKSISLARWMYRANPDTPPAVAAEEDKQRRSGMVMVVWTFGWSFGSIFFSVRFAN
ncbi:hypothetical protein HPP92_025519 [Vanilla planifolia]|uniref:Uncharacterized protein n=1 Tax=Vanilla planifolia TaxID=51239 RepID=A0A835PKS1_VANPL|nr:hypothetical protein HPP92_025519 [Vanilla planifolia]